MNEILPNPGLSIESATSFHSLVEKTILVGCSARRERTFSVRMMRTESVAARRSFLDSSKIRIVLWNELLLCQRFQYSILDLFAGCSNEFFQVFVSYRFIPLIYPILLEQLSSSCQHPELDILTTQYRQQSSQSLMLQVGPR